MTDLIDEILTKGERRRFRADRKTIRATPTTEARPTGDVQWGGVMLLGQYVSWHLAEIYVINPSYLSWLLSRPFVRDYPAFDDLLQCFLAEIYARETERSKAIRARVADAQRFA